MAKKSKKNKKNKKDRMTADDDIFMILAESDYQLMMMHAKLMIIQEHLGYDPQDMFDIAEGRFDELIMEDDE